MKRTFHIAQIVNQRGTMGMYAVVVIGAFLSIAAFAIDIGYAIVTKQELRNVADSAALAGTRALGQLYEGLSLGDQLSFVLTSDQEAIIQAAIADIALKNSAGGLSIVVPSTDVQIGNWDGTTFTSTAAQPAAVRVTVRRDGGANGPISTTFAKVFGVTSLELRANATAALLPIASVPPGQVDVPVGISKEFFETHGCGDTIKFHPTGTLDGCAGWHTFENQPANAATLNDILKKLKTGQFTSPEVIAGQTQFEYIGGDAASAFTNMQKLYDFKKDASGNWETFLVVYDRSDCNNPTGSLTVVGFAKATVYAVSGAPNNEILARIECGAIQQGRPGSNAGNGGAGFGTLSSVPGLVS
ncbi:MAG: pilus assembly protein TadG-related protein [Nitrospirales bacterium]|nr:hypothetical protein [Nitrospira sp.]MDR4501779.1 pilus assembly protein TadG-related protein [Nitrospirales bacterium]